MMRKHRYETEAGQSAVLFALMIVGLVLLVALAVDGGNVLNGRRVTQNAADSGALAGIHYVASSDGPTETALRIAINQTVEANGARDTDGIPGNEVNDNITIYYTDDRGNHLTTQPCYIVPCGSIPPPARGLDVRVAHEVNTFLLAIINRAMLDVGAGATATVRGGDVNNDMADNALVAFGNCTQAQRPLDLSATDVDIIGGLHSDTYFVNRGNGNHYHGQVTYGLGWSDTASPAGVYEPNPPGAPAQRPASGDPFAGLGLTVDRFNCTTGDIGQAVGACYDLTTLAPAYGNKITTQLLRQNSPDGGARYLDQNTGQLRAGLYYGGPYPFDFGFRGMVGTVTLVTKSYIKLTENDLQLTGYMPSDSVIPGLLLYSSLSPGGGKECWNHEQLAQVDEPINTTGNAGKIQPGVYHSDDKVGCVNLANPAECYELGSLQYNGLIYAPGGRAATSGHGATYVGAIVAYTIRVNGSLRRSEGGGNKPDKVGALFVYDSNLFPVSEQRIYLDE